MYKVRSADGTMWVVNDDELNWAVGEDKAGLFTLREVMDMIINMPIAGDPLTIYWFPENKSTAAKKET